MEVSDSRTSRIIHHIKRIEMKLVIFGATGMVGTHLVKQAIFNGHSVRAFGRNVFTAGLPDSKQLELVQGALFDAAQVEKAVRGCDAVLSALGGGIDGNDKTRSLGMKNIVAQMEKTGVRRIIGIGGLGVLQATEDKLLLDSPDYPEAYRAVGEEHRKAWEYLQQSKLDWTFVCPPDIHNEEATGSFHVAADYPPAENKYHIRAGDLALFMLAEMQQNRFVGKRVGISN